MSDINADDIKRDIDSICDAAGQAILIQGSYASNEAVNLQIIDNSLICSFIFPQNETARGFITDRPDREVGFLGLEILRMYSRYQRQVPFKFAMTRAVLLETANSFINISKRFANDSQRVFDSDRLYDQVMRMLDPEDKNDDGLMHDEYLYNVAKEFCEIIPAIIKTDNIDVFINLIKNGGIVGLGDHYTQEDYRVVKPRLIDLVNRICLFLNKFRERRPGESEDSFQFRNKIDSINFATPLVFQGRKNGIHLGFTTPFPASLDRHIPEWRDAEVRGIIRHRTLPAGIYLFLKSIEITQQKEHSQIESAHWLDALAKRAEACKYYMTGAQGPNQISDVRKTEIHLFYEDFMAPIFDNRRRVNTPDESLKKAKELFSSKKAFKDRLQQTSEKMEQAAQEMSSIKTVINSDELASDLGLLKDPRVRAIRSRYNNLG